ncbi:DUF1284 domain-containing protein [Wolbachia endosymbiont of Wuchereria bancrofti]|uniref:DUF1284 domain-containing protein n=1 Tax=Wolbachia endosymbiont of Wuchereria bancrofti TaxID=96496 RepID=UPI002481D91C|nr:DUF1284 domain-containing protein [Wolbachia endosymbiont of Wuchereria bancrofti]
MIRFSHHYFIYALALQRYGYFQDFIENYRRIASKVITNPNTRIKVTGNLDSICSACLNHRLSKINALHKLKF